MNNVSLNAGIRSNLIALQKTSALIGATQSRLSTGKKVNSAIDNPASFFTAESLSSRSSNLTSRLDGITKGIQTVKAADNALTSIKGIISQMKGVASDAKGVTDATERSNLATKFDNLRTQLDQLQADATYDGVNLLDSGKLTVEFGEKIGSATLSLNGFDGSSTGIGITAAANSWAADADIDAAVTNLETAESKIKSESRTLSSNLSVLTTRQDFTKNLVNILDTGAAELTNADMNEEAANLLALQTQQSLGVNALSLASQSAQSVLRLLS
jgi:flagellin-like hook-associated protein FlgL